MALVLIQACGFESNRAQRDSIASGSSGTRQPDLQELIGDVKLDCQWGIGRASVLCGLHDKESNQRIDGLETREKLISSFKISPFLLAGFEISEQDGTFRDDSEQTYTSLVKKSNVWNIRIGVKNPETISSVVLKVSLLKTPDEEKERFEIKSIDFKPETDFVENFRITNPYGIAKKIIAAEKKKSSLSDSAQDKKDEKLAELDEEEKEKEEDLRPELRITNSPIPELSWTDIGENASHYHIKIGNDPACKESILEELVPARLNYQPMQAIKDGSYYLCVEARSNAGTGKVAENNGFLFTIDTTPPEDPWLEINLGGGDVTYQTHAIGASGMLISQDQSCSTGSWIDYAASIISPFEDSTQAAFIKYVDLAGNETECVEQRSGNRDQPFVDILINDDATYTRIDAVRLNFSANIIVTEMALFAGSNCNLEEASWQPYLAEIKEWPLAQDNMKATVSGLFKDESGQISACVHDEIIHDSIAPFAILLFANGKTHVSTADVSWAINSDDSVKMYLDDQGAAHCEANIPETDFVDSGLRTLKNLNSSNPFYFRLQDAAGNISACTETSIVHDDIPPSGPSISIEAGAVSINLLAVEVTPTVTDGHSIYLTSDPSCSTGSTWSELGATHESTLPTPNSVNTLYAVFKDEAGNLSSCASDTIIHDDTPPSPPILSINAGADWTQSLGVTIALDYIGELPTSMYISQNPDCTSGGSWEAYTNSKVWNLASANVLNTIYVTYQDSTANVSSCESVSITHDNMIPSTSFVIAADAIATNQTAVIANVTIGDASEMFFSTLADCSVGAWEEIAQSKAITLNSSNANNFSYAKFRDLAGNETACLSDSILHDSIPPSVGSVTIASGAAFSSVDLVDLSIAATGADFVYVTETAGCSSGGTWQTYATSLPWTLMAKNSTASIYAKFKDHAGNISVSCASDSIIHDDIPPSGSLTIADSGESGFTNLTAPDLTLSSSDSNTVTSMYVSNISDCLSGGVEEAYSSSKTSWTLGTLNANTSVYAKFKDQAGNWSNCISGQIIHDSIAPTGALLIADSGNAGYTKDGSPDLNMTASDSNPVLNMYLTNTPGCSAGGSSESLSASKLSWPLAQNNSTATVYVKFQDSAGNWSTCISGQIEHDDIVPSAASISISSGATYTTSLNNSLNLSAVGASHMYLSNTAACAGGGSYETYNTMKSWSLGLENQSTSVFVKFKDLANNESSCVSDSIIHDGIDPIAPGAMDDGVSASETKTALLSWSAGTDTGSGIASYEIAIGSSSEGTDIIDWSDVTNTLSTSQSGLNLTWGNTYYGSIRSKDASGRISSATSGDGFLVGFLGQAYLKSSHLDSNDELGSKVAIDGDTVIAGLAKYENSAASNSGAALVYDRSGTTWTEQSLLVPTYIDAFDHFGWDVAISGDTAIVSAPQEDSNATSISSSANSDDSSPDSGAVFVYTRSGAIWSLQGYLKPSNSKPNNQFGYSLAISGDLIAVGAPYEDGNQNTITNTDSVANPADYTSEYDSGAVYIFKRSGSSWTQDAYIKASNSTGSLNFGKTLSIDSDTLAVGAPDEDSNQTSITNGSSSSSNTSLDDSGATYIYKRDGSGIWTQEAYVKAPESDSYDGFGHSVSISGNTLVVGAPDEDSDLQNPQTTASSNNDEDNSGAAYVFTRSGSTWSLQAYIKAFNTEAADRFGLSVSIDENDLVVGSQMESGSQNTLANTNPIDNNDFDQSGACYVFSRSGSSWVQKTYIKAANNSPANHFCTSVAIDKSSIVVGAPGEDSGFTSIINGQSADSSKSKTDSGAVFIMNR